MKEEKSFEEQALIATMGMTEEELKMAIQLQDSELAKHMLNTIQELVKTTESQQSVIELLVDKSERLENSVLDITKVISQVVAKMTVLAEMNKLNY